SLSNFWRQLRMDSLQRVFDTLNRTTVSVCAVSLPLIALFLALNAGAYLNINYYEEQLFALGVGCALFVAFFRYVSRIDGAGALQATIYRYTYPLLAWASLLICLVFAWRFEDYSMA